MNKLLQEYFGFDQVEIKKLNGYDNENYKVKTSSNSYIFKTYLYTKEMYDLVEAENATLLFLKENNQKNIPDPFPFKDGSFIKVLDVNGKKSICRMLSFLEGKFIGDVTVSEKMLESLGVFLAEIDLKFQNFDNYVLKSRKWEWDIQYLNLNKDYIQDIPDAKDRSIVTYFFQQFEEYVTPVLPDLEKSVIHNDANEWNVLIEGDEVCGIIDFGDLAYSPRINELAIAITYACYDKENGLDWALPILKAYHTILPIKENEIEILYYLIAARLCTSVCNSAHAKKENPNNEYASVSEKSAWNMLYNILKINPIKAESAFRAELGFDVKQPLPIEKALDRRYNHISSILSVSYDTPIYMDRSAFQYMYDVYGNTFLDAYNNIPHVGHSHPKVVKAGQKQMAKLNTNTRYVYDLLSEYAEKLLSKFPSSLDTVYFVNSGSAASDLAIRLAKNHTKQEKLMVMEHGYHGNTQTAIDISDYKFNNPKGQGQKEYVLKTVIPDTYKGKYTQNDGTAGKMYAQEAIEQIKESEIPIAAFITEPIVGCGGQVPLAKGYLKEIYPAIRQQGGVCISDEVQTGFGRLGEYFWGYEAQEVVPDIVIVGKPMANGHPMGAVITTSKIAESFGKGVEFFSSFGGNPVSCAIASSVLDVIEEEKLQENAKEVGNYYKSLFLELKEKFDCIGDVRGSGLFLGVEIVEENTKEPDTALAHLIKNELRNQYILISTDGPYDNVLKTKPPLIFTKENAKVVVTKIAHVLETHKSIKAVKA
ncbi:aminotransferase class III-fold pyridoxal phosphate-dependent enzyme [Aquimarina sp. 2201CG5-10]|uniref:aminotransferase class III-fold pyridoxal phosphate-dependent enzyme n=1 Tax=Aquimarina callyspongiae TaxID=3098150 RepID=UPI002AB419B8|nr:aminotransferase class III-fold pyridoxal phosphate-dependent enzyme [Aquimarina sp. 2201CG5-10]MDY8138226.1 aminotransferase class III-fold pyridoxal phosphate-dependent enzyme [Aquimarina sp. 2201CG5-10]